MPQAANLYQLVQSKANLANFYPHKTSSAVKCKKITEPKQPPSYTLFSNQTQQYIKLSEADYFLWTKIDGRHSVYDLCLVYFQRYGSFAYEQVAWLINFLEEQQLICQHHWSLTSLIHQKIHPEPFWDKLQRGWFKITNLYFIFPHADRGLTWLYKKLSFLFQKKIRWLLLIIAALGPVVFFAINQATNFRQLTQLPLTITLLFCLVLGNLIIMGIHELSHALAVKHFHHRVRKAGLMLYFGLPVFFVDTSEIWFEKKTHRLIVTAAGPLAELILAGLLSLLLLYLPINNWSLLLNRIIFFTYFSVLLNLNPLLKWDGYYLLTDFFDTPTLQAQSLACLKTFWRQRFDQRNQKNQKSQANQSPQPYSFAQRLVWISYGLGSIFTSLATIGFAYYFWQTQLKLWFNS